MFRNETTGNWRFSEASKRFIISELIVPYFSIDLVVGVNSIFVSTSCSPVWGLRQLQEGNGHWAATTQQMTLGMQGKSQAWRNTLEIHTPPDVSMQQRLVPRWLSGCPFSAWCTARQLTCKKSNELILPRALRIIFPESTALHAQGSLTTAVNSTTQDSTAQHSTAS